MYLTKKIKQDIFKKHGKKAENTGSAEGQIALFTHRINHLTEHLKNNKKDFNKLLSQVSSHVYSSTPNFINELVNKHKISSSIASALVCT